MVWLRRLVVFALVVCAGAAAVRAQHVLDEYRLKAAFVFQFPQFVEWPAASWTRAADVQLCVVQPNPFGRVLHELVRGEMLRGRPLVVKSVPATATLDGCHVLVMARLDNRVTAAVLKRVAGRPVLSVGDGSEFLDAGGIIELRVVDGRIRFAVSVANARRAGLQVSAQLLRLAVAVHGANP
jgi:hypothetical protein